MSPIRTSVRKHIDHAAAELIAAADKIRAEYPELAGAYQAVGQGLMSSHLMILGRHQFVFKFPEDCFIVFGGATVQATKGPVELQIFVPGDDLIQFTTPEDK